MTQISLTTPDKLDLDYCSREPIHIIGKTQAHGVLISCDPQNFKITQVGKNVTNFFGVSIEELHGKNLSYLLGEDHVKELGELVTSE